MYNTLVQKCKIVQAEFLVVQAFTQYDCPKQKTDLREAVLSIEDMLTVASIEASQLSKQLIPKLALAKENKYKKPKA